MAAGEASAALFIILSRLFDDPRPFADAVDLELEARNASVDDWMFADGVRAADVFGEDDPAELLEDEAAGA
jgi:hypothetical protein